MKKLNRKGFTLIELLAVIVILAIIVVVTVPTIISTIADARVSSIWNLAGSVANSYDTAAAQDLLSPGKTLGGIENSVTTSWQCISSLSGDKGTLAEILDLSATDVRLGASYTTPPTQTNGNWVIADTTCSAIKVKANGAAEVFLIAEDGGKFAVSGKDVYAVSSEDVGHQVSKAS